MDVKIINNTNFEINNLSIVLTQIFQNLDIGKKMNIIFVSDKFVLSLYFLFKK
ncbi:hypothetical protein ACGRT8_02000 [Candidatus Phytoplasma australasiaticum]